MSNMPSLDKALNRPFDIAVASNLKREIWESFGFSSKNIFDQGFTTCFFTSSTEIGRAVKVIFKKVKYLSYLVNCLLDNILPLSPTLPSWTLYKIIIIHYMPRKCFFFCVDKDIAHDSLMKSDSFGGSRNLEGGPGPKSWCLAKLSPPP